MVSNLTRLESQHAITFKHKVAEKVQPATVNENKEIAKQVTYTKKRAKMNTRPVVRAKSEPLT